MSTEEEIVVEEVTERARGMDQKLDSLIEVLRFIRADAQIPVPYSVEINLWGSAVVKWFPGDVAEAAEVVRRVGGKWEKNDPTTSEYNANTLVMTRDYSPLVRLSVSISRGQVCERKVVGTERRRVKKSVIVEVDEDVDIIEYDCGSLYSAAEKQRLAELEGGAA